ncbi:hypothetical protein ACW9HQ_37660, partial [Nocardia gipuzkoensis]
AGESTIGTVVRLLSARQEMGRRMAVAGLLRAAHAGEVTRTPVEAAFGRDREIDAALAQLGAAGLLARGAQSLPGLHHTAEEDRDRRIPDARPRCWSVAPSSSGLHFHRRRGDGG